MCGRRTGVPDGKWEQTARGSGRVAGIYKRAATHGGVMAGASLSEIPFSSPLVSSWRPLLPIPAPPLPPSSRRPPPHPGAAARPLLPRGLLPIPAPLISSSHGHAGQRPFRLSLLHRGRRQPPPRRAASPSPRLAASSTAATAASSIVDAGLLCRAGRFFLYRRRPLICFFCFFSVKWMNVDQI
ncbi:hypothetical protein BRADI_4g37575v3 [Brachypodium distachyon]|uniref:Uncharacterized protein n=1 Tax=Brachypodium distachyon TaxID=15368 RepID=A0A2K2CSW9_BRADI|nr:hypothetical protein BRADI_4g37575v3 [Brachypodium distachyon]